MAKKIVVTNAKGGVGKSTTSLNLADALRFVGFRVLLVDLDPSRNATSVYTKKREDIKTLKNLLEGEKAKNCIYKADFGDIIPGDKYLARERSELYRACTDDPAFIKKALKSVEKDYDYIIFDTPPIGVVADALLLKDLLAGFVVVLRERSTTHGDVQNIMDSMKLADAKILGFVKVGCTSNKKRSRRGYYYYQYY